jgi:hypothetical protein
MKKTIQTRLDQKDIDRLEKEAKKKGHTLSSFLRYLVQRFFKEQDGKKPN